MSNSKRARKFRAIEHLEDGIKAYLYINAMLDTITDDEHPHAKLARFVAKATLNELIHVYGTNNGDQALEELAERINSDPQGSDAVQDGTAAVPSL